MPKLKKDDPQFPERNSGSFLKAAVAATPLAIGAAAAMRGVAVSGAIKPAREAGIDQAMRHLSKHIYKGPPIPGIEEVNRFMNMQSGDITKQAWQWATQTVDPFTKNRLLGYTQGIERMSEAEARSAIAQTITGNESTAMSRIWRKFRSNIDILQSQQSLSGVLPTFTQVENLTSFSQQRTTPIATAMPEPFFRKVQNIAEELGAKHRIYGLTRPEIAGAGFGVWDVIFRNTKVGNINIQLPQVVGGVMLEGADLQTRRIAPDVLYIGRGGELTRIGRTEFFLREFEESIVPDIGGRLKTRRDVEQAVRQLKAKVFGELEAVPNVLPESLTAAQAQREALRGKAVDVLVEQEGWRGKAEYQPTFRQPTTAEITRLLESEEGRAMGLRGGVGPDPMARGRLSTAEWERFYLGPVEYGRRPEQPFREFQVTRETMEALGQARRGQKYRALEMAGEETAYANAARPKLKATYIDPKRHAGLLEQIAMGEGEAVIRSKTAGLIQFEQAATTKLIEAREDITNFRKVAGGELLGITPEGKPFILPKGSEITNVRRLTDQALQVEYLRRHQLRHGEKIFGGAKAVLLERGQGEFADISRRLGLGDEATEMFVSMDELRKNRSLHKRQIISSLEDMIRGSWITTRGGAPGEGLARRFFLGQGEAVGRTWAAENIGHRSFIRQAMQSAIRDLDLSAREFGTVFGAVPYVMKGGAQEAARLVREAAAGSPERVVRKMIKGMLATGTAGGLADIAYGGPRLEAGVMGSLEPRAFDILKGGALGERGEAIASEFARRLAVTSPEAAIAHEELTKTLASMTGGKVDLTGREAFRAGTSFEKFVEAGGGVLRPGGGIADIYVPGADVMKQMRPFETPTGVRATGGVSDIYQTLAYKVGLFQQEQLTKQELQKEIDYAADILRREWAPAGKGIGSLTRGKMIGSRFLRGVSAMEGGAETAIREAQTIGITEKAFEDMWQELYRSKMYTEDLKALENMKNRFLAGQSVGGMLARHPFIGEFSLQPVQMKRVEGAPDLMVLPEIKQDIRVRTEATRAFERKTLTLGPLVGLAGDKDADAYSAMLVGPRNEEAIRKGILARDSEFANRYAQHQVRMQLFRAGRAAPAEMTTIADVSRAMRSEVEKLAVGQRWIAPLSLEMTAAKQALTTFGQGQAAVDARFLLEWLEQTPISAKHMTAEEAARGGLESLMISITDAVKGRNIARLEANIASIVKDDATAKAMLTGNVFMDDISARELSRNLNVTMQQELKGINVPNATRELMRALSESDASRTTRRMQLLAGRGSRAKINEIAELAARGVFKAGQEGAGFFSKVSSAMTSATNLLGQAGRGIIKHHKPIGLGFAGSLALSAALSSPPETVGSGKYKIPDARLNMNKRKAADRMKPEDLQPPQQPRGQPTAPQLMRNQTVRLAMNQPQTSMRGTVRVDQNTNIPSMIGQLGSLSNNTSVNLRDSRTTVHPYEIASKLL